MKEIVVDIPFLSLHDRCALYGMLFLLIRKRIIDHVSKIKEWI